MTRTIIFSLLLLFVLQLSAREAKVERMYEDTMDLSARTESRQDNNGDDCALIKVQSTLQGLQFEGNVVGNVIHKAGEYWVYVVAQSRMLKVMHNSLTPTLIKYADHNVPTLKPRTVYVLQLAEEAAPAEKADFTFKVTPANASLMIDQAEHELKNGTLTATLTCGTHTYTAFAPGYKPQQNIFNVATNATNKLVIELDPKPGYTPPSTASNNSNYNNANNNNSSNNYNNNYNNSTSYTVGNTINGHEFVDLGLPSGLKWATCNVGATTPEAYGDYFAWGETSPKTSYTDDNCPTYKKDISWLRANGYLDSNGNLTPSHDAARQNWGGTWRLPTKADLEELKANTNTTWTQRNGVKGRLITSKKNGNSIFIPAAGFRYGTSLDNDGSGGYCWSSTPHGSGSEGAYLLGFGSGYFDWTWGYRYYGFSVRAVSE